MEGTCLECTFPLRESECEFYGPEVTTLMHAAFNGQKQCVNDLIQAGADVNIEDNNSSTALVWAVAGDQFQAGAKLKKYKEEEAFEKSNSEGSTSVYHDKSGTAVKMLQQGSRSIDHNGCARLLFEAGAEVNLVHNGEKATALAKSSFYGNYRCVEFLLHAGADVNATTEDGITILMAAVVNTDENCENVIEYARGLYVKEYHRHDKCVELILQAGADMNAKDKTGRTALMAAIANGPLCPDILIKAGADVNTVDSSGNTALIYAAEEVQNECIDLLIHAGADVNITCNSGFTALHHLAGANSLHGVKQILLSGAHVNMLNADGHNALHFAIPWKNADSYREVLLLLFAAGDSLETAHITNFKHLYISFPEYLLFEDIKVDLKHMCRQVIRKCLIDLDPHPHLFDRIPQLKGELPIALIQYLLYNLSLEPTADREQK